jgi:filamentous hemagglutinin
MSLSQVPSFTNGISTISYQIPSYDRAGNMTGYKDKLFTKTVYDPGVITEQKIFELGRQAAAEGYINAMTRGMTAYNGQAGGVKFRVYLDPTTGTVRNFHPR